MASKSKNPKNPSWVEVWKGIRKDPIPPKRVVPVKTRDLEDELAEDEVAHWMDWRGEDYDEFEE